MVYHKRLLIYYYLIIKILSESSDWILKVFKFIICSLFPCREKNTSPLNLFFQEFELHCLSNKSRVKLIGKEVTQNYFAHHRNIFISPSYVRTPIHYTANWFNYSSRCTHENLLQILPTVTYGDLFFLQYYYNQLRTTRTTAYYYNQ